MSEMLRRAIALGRYGALTRPRFGKPRGTRDQAADRKEPRPGHYYPGTAAWFIVLDEPLDLDVYVEAMQMTNLSEEMRGSAVHVVEEYGDASHVPALSRVLHEGPCESTRRSAASALASIGGPPAEASLWRALESEAFPTRVREAALDGLLDLLTPSGWENYTFMNATRSSLSADVYDRIACVRGLSFDVTNILRCFDKEEIAKFKWPCPGKPEDLVGQPIGMYHCEFCGEMQIAGVPHLEPQSPENWEEPFPKVDYSDLANVPEDPEEPEEPA